jgi:DNA-directed RNA polymerase specialized sigma subunit
MRKKLNRPWLTASDVELPTSELKEVSKSWNEQTWNDYLNWFQSGCSEKLVSKKVYDVISEELEKNVFENFGYKTCPKLQSFCDRLLSILPVNQQYILRAIFFDGKSQVVVAHEINKTRACVSQNKLKALRTLKREHDGKMVYARQYMRGADVYISEIKNLIWNEKLSAQPCEIKPCADSEADKVLLKHPCSELRHAFRELSQKSRQTIYLKFWCELSNSEIARKSSLGLNTVEQIIESTVFKIKSQVSANLYADKISA